MANRTITPEPRSAQTFSSSSAKKTTHPTRTLKVRKSYYTYQQKLNPRAPYKQHPPVPSVLMKGYWLNEVGFTVDTTLVIELGDGCLVIRPSVPLTKSA